MGLDTFIYFKANSRFDEQELSIDLPMDARVVKYISDEDFDANFEIDQLFRYYQRDYERGEYGLILGIMIRLLGDGNIEKVWYGSGESMYLVDDDYVIGLAMHAMRNGNRPYLERNNSEESRGE